MISKGVLGGCKQARKDLSRVAGDHSHPSLQEVLLSASEQIGLFDVAFRGVLPEVSMSARNMRLYLQRKGGP